MRLLEMNIRPLNIFHQNLEAFNPLQLSALSFLMVALVAPPISAIILTINALVSFYVHRVRPNGRDLVDLVDNLCVGVWVIHNIIFWLSNKTIIPVIMAILVVILRYLRLHLKHRYRIITHIAMHLSGAVGTYLLF